MQNSSKIVYFPDKAEHKFVWKELETVENCELKKKFVHWNVDKDVHWLANTYLM